MNWFLLALKNTFNYKGRARRIEYGSFLVGSYLVAILFAFLLRASESLGLATFATALSFLSDLVNFVFLLSQMALTARRLHDLGYSGWWQVAMGLVGIVLVVLMAFGFASETNVELGILCAVLMAILYLGSQGWLIFKDGQRFTNKYGEDPKASGSEVAEI
ncbi:hypothetical protein B0187_09145 [Haemophilus paracuniculus]|uniref:DUF805 domain-containing protein n=1 Tax=Haemophilus paracuniculus TaxID=734 RepID=A0A1T0AQI1_9PAST|nr:DUF805 domain-containing protein [Haemophilus paracuniculus]OOR98246.1 hypothetical protein B0187_09145 [Haemophilus paracuniculus]